MNLRIAVVDDCKLTRKGISLCLDSEFASVVEFDSIDEFVDSPPGEQFDVILCDVLFADAADDRYCFDHLAELKAPHPDAKLVLLSMLNRPGVVRRFEAEAEVTGHFLASYCSKQDVDELPKLIGNAVAGRKLGFSSSIDVAGCHESWVGQLSDFEEEVVGYALTYETSEEIADQLGVPTASVVKALERARAKSETSSRPALMIEARRQGMVPRR